MTIEEEKLGPRTVWFDADHAPGVLFIRDWGMPGYGGWHELAEARGRVDVPCGKELMLKLTWSGSENLASLAMLGPNDLQWLDCRDSKIDDAQMVYLRGLTGLHDLGLGHTNVGDEGLRSLSRMTRMRELYLAGTRITDEGLKPIALLETLRALALNQTAVSDEGLAELARLVRLRRLWLKGTRITDAGLTRLENLKSLQRLDLSDTSVTAEGAAKLKKSLPNCYLAR